MISYRVPVLSTQFVALVQFCTFYFENADSFNSKHCILGIVLPIVTKYTGTILDAGTNGYVSFVLNILHSCGLASFF